LPVLPVFEVKQSLTGNRDFALFLKFDVI